jgi:hypothetical protein
MGEGQWQECRRNASERASREVLHIVEGVQVKIESKDFRVRSGVNVKLENWPTSV